QPLRRVAVVVHVDLDLAVARPTELHETVHVLGPVLVVREEERVPRRPPVGVAVPLAQPGIPLPPAPDTCPLAVEGGTSPARLEVVDETESDVERPRGARPGTGWAAEVSRQPDEDMPARKRVEEPHRCRRRGQRDCRHGASDEGAHPCAAASVRAPAYAASYRRAMASRLPCTSTHRRAWAPIRARTSGAAARLSNARAKDSGVRSVTTSPVDPSCTISPLPPALLATAGNPAAAASSRATE